LIAKTHRWQKTAMAAALVLLGFSNTQAFALSLGRLSVQSALGEPLRAEVDVPEITAEEAASLKAAVAQPDAFIAAGLEYSPALNGIQVSLQRRADGRAYLRISSDRAVNEPFVDLILEATWASGRIVRDYTVLLDPPSLKKASPAPTLAQTPLATPTPAPAAQSASAPPLNAEPAQAVVTPRATPESAPENTQPAKPEPKAPVKNEPRVTVKSGDTASKIASLHKAEGISLDQMLVAMLRSNPEAFIRDNLNRVRAGAVMTIPSAATASSVAPSEAKQIVIAQSKDFNDFRRGLATQAPQAKLDNADRKVSGTVNAKVAEKNPASASPDKLTLSKGAVSAHNEQTKIAQERQAQEADARAAEIAKNISDLNKIAAGTPSSAAAPSLPPPAAPQPDSAGGPTVETPPSLAPAPPAAEQPQAKASPTKPLTPEASPEGLSLMDSLVEDPVVPIAAASLIALLGGFGLYRLRQRKKKIEGQDSDFSDEPLEPAPAFGGDLNEAADTQRAAGTTPPHGSADEVDPIGEADVYLAYGRDSQAESILKEALRNNPERLAIHSKLLEIYAKRQDTLSFEATAKEARQITGGVGPDWQQICALGLGIDPNNSLYQTGTATSAPVTDAEVVSDGKAEDESAIGETLSDPTTSLDLDLDLDLSAEEPVVSAPEPVEAAEAVSVEAANEPPEIDLDLDLDLDLAAETEPSAKFTPVVEMPNVSLSLNDLDLSLDEADSHQEADSAVAEDTGETAPPEAPEAEITPIEDVEPESVDLTSAEPAAESSADPLDFDLESLSLELDNAAEAAASATESVDTDALSTKLALAEEFISIGDEDGARALIEEVIEEATGEMLAKAQKALEQLR
jgi:pilus assembly protein FimV